MSALKGKKTPHQQVTETLREAARFVEGTDEPISDEEAEVIEEVRQSLPRADKAALMAMARKLGSSR